MTMTMTMMLMMTVVVTATAMIVMVMVAMMVVWMAMLVVVMVMMMQAACHGTAMPKVLGLEGHSTDPQPQLGSAPGIGSTIGLLQHHHSNVTETWARSLAETRV